MPKRSRSRAESEADPPPAKPRRKAEAEAEAPAIYRDPPLREVTSSGRRYTLKVTSWNVDGLRAWVKKGGLKWVLEEAPDVLCLQETKCGEGSVPPEVRGLSQFPHQYWASAEGRPGYSGVGLLARTRPLRVTYGIGDEEHDREGRVITAEFPSLIVVSAYVPNSGRGLSRLAYRQRWDRAFHQYLTRLAAGAEVGGAKEEEPITLCGDLNVAHTPLDLRHPRANQKTAGFTGEERAGLERLLQSGFTDSFRHLYPGVPHAYTFWTYVGGARGRNVGWRLDYFLLSAGLEAGLCDSKIRSQVMGSDHCPITLYLAI